jgi:hypothetical protein
LNYKKAYEAQLQGKTFHFKEDPDRLYIFGPIPNENAIIIRSSHLGAEADFSPEEVWNNILELHWILD